MITSAELSPDPLWQENPYADYRRAVFHADWPFTSTCGHCANICWPTLEERKENRRLIRGSGVVALGPDGTRRAARTAAVEVDTPLGSRVAVDGDAGEVRPDLNLRDRVAMRAVKG